MWRLWRKERRGKLRHASSKRNSGGRGRINVGSATTGVRRRSRCKGCRNVCRS